MALTDRLNFEAVKAGTSGLAHIVKAALRSPPVQVKLMFLGAVLAKLAYSAWTGDYAHTADTVSQAHQYASPEPAAIVPQPDDLQTIARYDTDGSGGWSLAEFRDYVFGQHLMDQEKGGPDLVEFPDSSLEKLKQAVFGGKYMPYELCKPATNCVPASADGNVVA